MTKKQSGNISKRMQRRAEARRKKRLTQLGVAALIIIFVAAVGWAFWDNSRVQTEVVQEAFPAEISVDEAYQMYRAGAFLLDVRTPEEWDEIHVPGTTHVPLDELENRLDEVPRDQDVVVICRSGNRSKQGLEILLAAGFTRVTSMTGGLQAWSAAGYPME